MSVPQDHHGAGRCRATTTAITVDQVVTSPLLPGVKRWIDDVLRRVYARPFDWRQDCPDDVGALRPFPAVVGPGRGTPLVEAARRRVAGRGRHRA